MTMLKLMDDIKTNFPNYDSYHNKENTNPTLFYRNGNGIGWVKIEWEKDDDTVSLKVFESNGNIIFTSRIWSLDSLPWKMNFISFIINGAYYE